MFVYFSLYGLIVLLSIGIDKNIHQKKFFFLFILFSILILFSTFRGDIGTDIGRYNRDYNYVRNLEIFSISESFRYLPYDFLYTGLNVLLGNILRLDFWSIKFLVSLIFCFGFYHFSEKIKNYTISSIIFIPTLYLIFSFSLIRQAISISIGLYIITLLLNKDYKKLILASLVAMLFHKYSIIYLIIYILLILIEKIEENKKKFIYVIYVLITSIIFTLLYKFTLLGHFNWYVISTPANHALQFPIVKLLFLNYSYLVIFFLVTLSERSTQKRSDKIVFIIAIFNILFLIIYFISPIVTLRFMMYLIVINPFIVIKFKQYFNNKFDEIIMLILFLIHLSYMAIMFNYSAHSGSYIPYNFYFF